jgi:hypothetical protein
MSLINDALKRANQTPPGRPPAPPRPPLPVLQPVGESQPGKSPLLFLAASAVFVVLLGLGGWLVWTGAFGKPKNAPAVPAATALDDPHPKTTTAAKSEIPAAPKMPSAGGRLPATPTKSLASAALTKATAQAEVEAMEKKIFSHAEAKPAPPAPVATRPPGQDIPPAPPPPAVPTVVAAPAPVSPPPAKIETAASAPPPVVAPAPAPAVAVVPPPPAPPPFPALKLRGIFYRRTNPTTLINGETLAEGDTVDDAKVVKIDRESVTVEWHGQRRVLRLP